MNSLYKRDLCCCHNFFIICCAKEARALVVLDAVQFGHNWMKKKFRGQPKLDEAASRVQFGCQRNFLSSIISKVDRHVVFLLINYIAG